MPATNDGRLCGLDFATMGTTATVVVIGPRAGRLASMARWRLDALETRWSMSQADSELRSLNTCQGRAVVVSAETFDLVRVAVNVWRKTQGRCNPVPAAAAGPATTTWPTVPAPASLSRIGALAWADPAALDAPRPQDMPAGTGGPGWGSVRLDPSTRAVYLPHGVQLDPTRFVRAVAVDLVVDELIAQGAEGVSVSVGGCTSCLGVSPTGAGWRVGVTHPFHQDRTAAVLGLSWGAIATRPLGTATHTAAHASAYAGAPTNPFGGDSATVNSASVTVVATSCWWADSVASLCEPAGIAEAGALLDSLGAAGLLLGEDGRCHATASLARYLQ